MGILQQDNVPGQGSSTVPQWNPQPLPQDGLVMVSESIESNQQSSQNVHGSSTVPPGNPQPLPQDGPAPVYEGQRNGLGESLPQAPTVPRPTLQRSVFEGDGEPNDVPRVRGQGLQNISSSTVPRGNPQSLPQDGPFYFSHARGQESGPNISHARGQESGRANDVPTREGVESGTSNGAAKANPSAQQWLGGSTTTDPMALLAGGMAQIQAVMLKQMQERDREKDEDKSPETVKPGTTTLPVLADVNPLTSSVDIMDWLEVITSTMQDLSDGSTAWWAKVRLLANTSYAQWTSASPVEKLNIQPPKDDELESGRWSRVNSRASSMIMMALSEAVRQEMVQRRSTGSATALIFRLLCLYQPGGQQEKVTILQSLQQPEPEVTAAKAAKSLRAWARWLRRCKELGVSAPDPSLLARGLSTITKAVLEKEPEANFRTSLVRSHLSVDTTPSFESVEKYYHHLLAECESLAFGSVYFVNDYP